MSREGFNPQETKQSAPYMEHGVVAMRTAFDAAQTEAKRFLTLETQGLSTGTETRLRALIDIASHTDPALALQQEKENKGDTLTDDARSRGYLRKILENSSPVPESEQQAFADYLDWLSK